MKKVKIEGKLSLKKEVVAKLNELQMNNIKGGAPNTVTCGPPTASVCLSVCNSRPCCK
jgi:natural product precursor